MAAMSTALSLPEFNNGNITYMLTGHTFEKAQLVLQKKRVPSGAQTVATDTITVVYGTEDSNGELLPSKIAFEVSVRRPIGAIAADMTAALATFRDVVAGDEFAAVVDKQSRLG